MSAPAPGSHPPPAPEELARRFARIRSRSEALAGPASAEDCAIQSMEDASPTKWHLAHTTWFFETFALERAEASFEPFHPRYRFLFNSYYHEVGAQYARPRRGMLSRPPLDEVLAYRRAVDERTLRCLADPDAPEWLRRVVEIGLHHEQQHQELILTDLKHVLGQNPLRPAYREDLGEPPSGAATPLRWQRFPAGLRSIGHDGEGFAFDNEGPRHTRHVPAFELASRAVTVGEYRAFIEDGGYETPTLWLSDGWAWVQRERIRAPLYWQGSGDAATTLTLGGERPLRSEEPVVHVSYYEADAFATWADARLPDEAEWEHAAESSPLEGNFVEGELLHPRAARGRDGLLQLFGDVWEWTRSDYAPYPGFRAPEGALGEYNGKFMCNQRVLRGGSCATPRSHVRATYRNFFPPPARWQFSGIRLARDA